ncbi:MAG TPA: anthrone oxygenase family protein [Gammaproteobacteria bacterium]|nr:anthrone oxygenase family protein [Gammaproteobacteria bacterium]
MIDELAPILTVVAAVGSGLVAGIFFAFSTFVMRALDRLPPAQGIAAMQSINVAVINPWFMTVFFGTAVACLILVVFSLLDWNKAGAGYMLSGGALYLIGTILVTIVFNVPRNDALAAVDPESADGARLWADYLKSWTAWNHVRTAAALASAALFTVA